MITKTYTIEVNLNFVQCVEAKTLKEAKDKVANTFYDEYGFTVYPSEMSESTVTPKTYYRNIKHLLPRYIKKFGDRKPGDLRSFVILYVDGVPQTGLIDDSLYDDYLVLSFDLHSIYAYKSFLEIYLTKEK